MVTSDLLPSFAGYIDGRWAFADGPRTLEVRNPATGELLAHVPDMGAVETLRAVEAALVAQETRVQLETRRAWLLRLAATIEERKSEIGRIITLENGKPHKEAEGEAEYSAGFYRYAAENLDRLKPRVLAEHPRGCEWSVHHRPAGVAGLITPWNFPFAMIAKKLAAAIAADCAVIVKPSEKTPLSMIALFELLRGVGLPAGRANLVIGNPAPIGQVLCEHPGVRILSFTGSTAVGRMLISATAAQVKRLSLELGGNAPFLVFGDTDPVHAADQLVQNKLRASGQTCVCTNRVFVHRSLSEPFTRALVERVQSLRVGDGMEPGVDLGPLIDRAGYEKVRAHLEDALSNGAVRVAGTDVPPAGEDFGFFFPPTVLSGVTMGMACTREETFGPIFPIIEFETEAEVLAWANQTDYGLAAYVFTEDEARAERVVERLRFGHVGLNTGTGPAPEAPFGGMKQSGFGREGGAEGLMEFVEIQTVPRRSTPARESRS